MCPTLLNTFLRKRPPCRRRRPQPAVGVADERADQSHRAAAPSPVAPRTALISTNHIPRVALGPRRAALAETLPESDTIGCMACNINISIRCSTDTPRFAATCQLQLNSRNPRSPLLLKLLPSPALTQRPNKIAYSSYTPRRSYVTVRSHMATEEKSISGDRMLVSSLYSCSLPTETPTVSGEIQSPMGVASVEFIDPREPVAVIPILRAGLVLVEHASSILPAIKTYHLGISRDEETLQPSIYLNKLPENFPEGSRIFVVDPMLATGGTVVAALNLVKERGVENKQIKVISAVAAPPALQKLSENFHGLHVYTGIIDPTVNDKGFIVPGLGDAGDRSFGT
ncbi:Uracil phosphoribosyltransferase [Citrus sinensis]|uniref:Uracil phosphoribosyltransferase n=1 Tax=Citrus sinensis TaxID=2711 RepID=A0ACB8JUH9_CITSI|nr:Uracil phosphoribosyltransferase [Citrus sinensis]